MYEQFVPPAPHDLLREGIPNLRHGTVNVHPIELMYREQQNDDIKYDYFATAAIYGTGFADHLKKEREVIKRTEIAYKSTQRPNTLGLEISTGEIDDLDFPDMFAPNGQRDDIDIDVHEVLESHFLPK